jgi:maltooligosyltrehalose trehalohydrolase
MTQGNHGWWHADVEEAHHGSDYGFLLDDDPKPYPDPRSEWQPNGVHGLSRVLDHSQFIWSDQGWSPTPLSKAIMYEIHIGTFTPEGTFAAAQEKLPYLRDLGITHIELMPVNSFPGKWGWGYDGVALYAPQELYGGPNGLKQFVDACHASGISVLLDVVYNHFGPVGNYTGRYGQYITENHHTPWGGAVNFESAGSTEVRRFFLDNALMWLRDYHFDGLRLDAIDAFIDRTATHFLEQMSAEVSQLSNQLGRSLILVAESDLNDPKVITPRLKEESSCPLGGYGLDAQWSDDFHHAIIARITGEQRSYYSDFGSIEQIAKAFNSVYVYDGVYSEFRGRYHGRPVKNLSAHRFVSCIQNHDQIGNRAFGERIQVISGDRKAKLTAAILFTAPFVPLIFQGEEFASSSPFLYFANHDDPELARSVSEGRRREHAHDGINESIPDPEAEDTFFRTKLNWEEVEKPHHAEMLAWYKSLIHLRKSTPDLLDGDLSHVKVKYDEAQGWIKVQRGSIELLYNLGDTPASFDVPGIFVTLMSTDSDVAAENGYVILHANGFAALQIASQEISAANYR